MLCERDHRVIHLFDDAVRALFYDAVRITLRDPSAVAFFLRMCRTGVFLGTSLTVTRLNIDTVLDEQYLDSLMRLGCRLFFFVEYVPVREDTELPVLFIAFPGDEEVFGGCLAAGRGFVHISPSGRVEPCPFAPYSDTSVRSVPLRDALTSPLLLAIRDNHERLTETNGGCALWSQRKWVRSLLPGSHEADTAGPGEPHADDRDLF